MHLSIMYQYQSEEQSASRPYRDPAWASGACASSVDRCLADVSCTGEVHLKPTPCNDANLAYMLRALALPVEARWPRSRKSFLAIRTARQNVYGHRQSVSDQSATHGIAQPSLAVSLPIFFSLAMLRHRRKTSRVFTFFGAFIALTKRGQRSDLCFIRAELAFGNINDANRGCCLYRQKEERERERGRESEREREKERERERQRRERERYIYIYVRIYIYIHTWVYTHTHIYIYVCTGVHTSNGTTTHCGRGSSPELRSGIPLPRLATSTGSRDIKIVQFRSVRNRYSTGTYVFFSQTFFSCYLKPAYVSLQHTAHRYILEPIRLTYPNQQTPTRACIKAFRHGPLRKNCGNSADGHCAQIARV